MGQPREGLCDPMAAQEVAGQALALGSSGIGSGMLSASLRAGPRKQQLKCLAVRPSCSHSSLSFLSICFLPKGPWHQFQTGKGVKVCSLEDEGCLVSKKEKHVLGNLVPSWVGMYPVLKEAH